MQISLAALTGLLLHSTCSSSAIIPQVPFNYAPATEATYGYAGPGVYRIVSYGTSFAVSLNTSESTTGLVAMPAVTDDDAQRWLISDVSATQKMIINNGTGSVLGAIKDVQTTRAAFVPPYDLTARWTIDFDRYKDYTGSPVMLTNVGRKDTVLDLWRSQKKTGTPIITYRINKPRTDNQAWLLEFLEQPAAVQLPLAAAPKARSELSEEM